MRFRHWPLAGMLLGVLAPPAGAALLPQEVLVVANANAEGSVALAKYYALSRNILPERIISLRCTAEPEVSREEYNQNIRDPIREYLRRHDGEGRIKCLALLWGVPVRVAPTAVTEERKELLETYKTLRQRLQARFAVGLKLLDVVGATFPEPRTEGLRPLGHLFEDRPVPAPETLPGLDSMKADLAKKMRSKAREVSRLTDRKQRLIAARQLAGLNLEAHGARYLLEHRPGMDVPGVPGKDELRKEIDLLRAELTGFTPGRESAEQAREIVDRLTRLDGVAGAHAFCDRRVRDIDWVREDAAVDSELALLWEKDYPLRGWLPNPMNWRFALAKTRPADAPTRVLMAARIDGPRPRDALRIVKDSIAAEKAGLTGKFYIDAGGRYAYYDEHLKALARIVGKGTRIPVVLDTDKKVFGPGSCPDAALYVGWYSVGKYVPAFTWARGAVGWHVASIEAVHLRAAGSDEWCVKLIQNGVAATLGAVNEPFLGAFPLPQDFFALLLTGQFTVAECYWRTLPTVSWRITLIADPLYNPFKLKGHLSTYDLPPELAGRKREAWDAPLPTPPEVDTRPAE